MKKLFTIITILLVSNAYAQSIISGKVTDEKNNPLMFVNVALEGTYDGATTDEQGKFSFKTDEKGNLKLTASMIGFEAVSINIGVNSGQYTFDFKLKELITTLNAVVVSAGMFEASDEKKMVMLKPLDIVTTAGGNADITSVMQLLPGSNRVGEQEGLFVRGGSASETKTVIDGMIVQNPFFSSTPDLPSRGRFDPFMFKGTAFSTGGYSAQYGQALSSVLLLNTVDKQSSNTSTTVGVNMVSTALTHTHKGWLTGTLYYSNITPLIKLVNNTFDFKKVPEGLGAAFTVNEVLPNKATIKVYSTVSDNRSAINLPGYDAENNKYVFDNKNFNTFNNASYRQTFKDGLWVLQSGVSYSKNIDDLSLGGFDADRKDERLQARLVMSKLFGNNRSSSFNFGAESHHINLSNQYGDVLLKLKDNYNAVFAESEMFASKNLAVRVGVRGEYSSVINRFNLAPRLSMAYKTGKYAQFSLAAGTFYQNPEKEYLYLNSNLNFEKANHIIGNYQIIKEGRTFRTEVFYKDYDHLVRESASGFDPNPYRFPMGQSSNTGYGYAKGFDVFLRDQKSVKNGDVWITYSFLDTERLFKNYTRSSMPHFATKHNMSLVYKQFITKISTNIGLTYSLASGRPFYSPGENTVDPFFTKSFQNMSLMASKIRQRPNSFAVFYLIVDNILGRNNTFGYRFSADGSKRYEVNPPIRRMIFVGMTWTFGKLNGRSKEADLNF